MIEVFILIMICIFGSHILCCKRMKEVERLLSRLQDRAFIQDEKIGELIRDSKNYIRISRGEERLRVLPPNDKNTGTKSNDSSNNKPKS